jgi:NADH-quinone oxidoreductase subunit A
MGQSSFGLYLPLVVMAAVAAAFATLPLGLAWLWAKKFSPRKPGPSKEMVYECGLKSDISTLILFKPEYYLYAIVFLVFDVEAIFLVPFAVAFLQLPIGAAVAMLIFILLLVEGLIWAWKKGVLNWV